MKRVLKGDEPASLRAYRQAQPQASWDELKNDAQHGGNSDAWWTYTVASYDVAIITMIIGAALVWRSPPASVRASE